MKEKIKNSVWAKMGIITGVVLIVALGVYLAMPHYSILQKTRSLSIFSGVNDFSISPGKVKVVIPVKGESVTIPITINNGPGETVFTVSQEDPTKFDNGYFAPAADGSGYKFTFSKASLDLEGNSIGTFDVTIRRTAFSAQKNIEAGIAVSQTTNANGISVVRSYLLEIEN
jgi:hypothetical protein